MKNWLSFLLVSAITVAAAALDSLNLWHFRNPLPTGNPLSAVQFLNGHFISVGSSGEVIVSSNGVEWTRHVTPGADLAGVAFGNGVYVVVGSDSLGPRI